MKNKCELCGVIIEDNVVHFSSGAPATRGRLYARVCNYALARDKTGCINSEGWREPITDSDHYSPP